MANYCVYSRTNYFRVTDEKRYAELFAGLYPECDADTDVGDFTKEINGVIYHGFGCYDSIAWYNNKRNRVDIDNVNDDDVEDDDIDDDDFENEFDTFIDELQAILPDDDAFILYEVGHEKLKCLTGFVLVVTKNEIRQSNMGDTAIDMAREMLDNKKFRTESTN